MKAKTESDMALSSRIGLVNSIQYDIYLNDVQDKKLSSGRTGFRLAHRPSLGLSVGPQTTPVK